MFQQLMCFNLLFAEISINSRQARRNIEKRKWVQILPPQQRGNYERSIFI